MMQDANTRMHDNSYLTLESPGPGIHQDVPGPDLRLSLSLVQPQKILLRRCYQPPESTLYAGKKWLYLLYNHLMPVLT